MGVVRRRNRKDWPEGAPRVLGYEEHGDEVVLRCPDESCAFADQLPLMLVDEWIYRQPPTMLIGTVDKFASLTWREPVRALFGISEDGTRFQSPPTLILQDELHLISGPLGSMVGLYESVVDELCTTEQDGSRDTPKGSLCYSDDSRIPTTGSGAFCTDRISSFSTFRPYRV